VRDFKSGGYNLEGTRITGNRLVVLILLIAIAYTTTMQGKKSSKWGYKIHRSGEEMGRQQRHSSFILAYMVKGSIL